MKRKTQAAQVSKSKSKLKRTQVPRRVTHERTKSNFSIRNFNYSLDYRTLNLRKEPDLYRVGIGEQGVLLVEPYKSEILPYWRFKTPLEAKHSAAKITKLFRAYLKANDFIGMDMARKFLQMGFTRSRRYANHSSGRKYGQNGEILPFKNDPLKAKSAVIFKEAWKKVELNPIYRDLKIAWKKRLG